MADVDTNGDVPSRPEYMLTTVDNPFDPFMQWDEWYAWDQSAGYHTPGFLARVALISDDLSEADQHRAIQEAIDEIVQENVLGVFRKVREGDVQKLTVEAETERKEEVPTPSPPLPPT